MLLRVKRKNLHTLTRLVLDYKRLATPADVDHRGRSLMSSGLIPCKAKQPLDEPKLEAETCLPQHNGATSAPTGLEECASTGIDPVAFAELDDIALSHFLLCVDMDADPIETPLAEPGSLSSFTEEGKFPDSIECVVGSVTDDREKDEPRGHKWCDADALSTSDSDLEDFVVTAGAWLFDTDTPSLQLNMMET